MRTKLVALATTGVLAAAGLSACTTDKSGAAGNTTRVNATKENGRGSAGGKVGVILPDRTTSQRWGTDDPKFLKAAFDEAGVPVDIRNADNDKDSFQRIADGMIADGVKVLMIANIDSESGKAVLDKARAEGIATIDYDRLTLNGGADYYVSFDNVKVGELQGRGLVSCLFNKGVENPRVAYLNGSPTDNNAAQFKQGYDRVLVEKYDANEYWKGPDQDVPDWSNKDAQVIFQQMWDQMAGGIHGVLAANDGLGNAAITVLKKYNVNGKIPVTGQDATVQGLRNILAGDQCMTVYKPIKDEAGAAADLAIGLFKGEKKYVEGRTKDPVSGAYVASVLLPPKAIFKGNIKDVITDGFVTRKALCAGSYATLCEDNGL
ncbi:MAG TPA: substrate-binding domain-containing protein [Actinoplanes sp.]